MYTCIAWDNLQFPLQFPMQVTNAPADLPATLHPAHSSTSETRLACRAQLQQQLWEPVPAPGSANRNEAAALVSLILAFLGAYVSMSWQLETGAAPSSTRDTNGACAGHLCCSQHMTYWLMARSCAPWQALSSNISQAWRV